MVPTLAPGDRFLCHKRVPIERWSVVVFHPPTRPHECYVFRIAGLPGETIEIRNGLVHANAAPQPPPQGVVPYVSQIGSMRGGAGTQGQPMKLGPDEYYLLGDNTTGAGDSRFFDVAYPGHQRGAVPRDQIVGRVTYIYWPVARWRRF
jgi:signal peptidase I